MNYSELNLSNLGQQLLNQTNRMSNHKTNQDWSERSTRIYKESKENSENIISEFGKRNITTETDPVFRVGHDRFNYWM